MSRKIKEIKQLTETGYVSTPIGCDAENVDLSDGMTLEEYAASVEEHIEDNISHITSKDRTNWDSKLDSAGDSQDNTTTFTSNDNASPTAWTDVDALTSGEKHSSIFSKISTMFKNIRWLYKMLGTTDISSMGNGTVTGALSQLNTDKVLLLINKAAINDRGNFSCNVKKGEVYLYFNTHQDARRISLICITIQGAVRVDDLVTSSNIEAYPETIAVESSGDQLILKITANTVCRGYLFLLRKMTCI